MLARRIIAIAPDKQFGKKLSVALMAAGGTVDWHASADELGKGELGAALLVVHVPEGGDLQATTALINRLAADAKAIVLLHQSNLSAVVDIMLATDRIAGMLVAENLDLRELSAMAMRVLAGDIFGLEKVSRWGTLIHNNLVGDYQEKSLCIAQISEFAETIGVRRKYREAIEQCIDEMLMNALYDAPVDETGKQIFSEIPTKTRISLRVEQKVVVQYACDGRQFAISVRDAFGTLERGTVLRYLHKCLHSDQQIDRKAGGAGLGLYLMVNSASEVYFNVLPGVATEAVCVFDLETPKIQLESFGFFTERIDASGRLAGGPVRRLPSGAGFPVERRRPRPSLPPQAPAMSKAVVAMLAGMIVVVLGLIGAVAYTRSGGSKVARTAITVSTEPKGATIEIEGKNVGVTADGALTVPELEIGRAYPVVARLDGYEPKQAVVQPTKEGRAIALKLTALAPTVKLDTMPVGAEAFVDGKSLGPTPLVLTTFAAGTTVQITFKKAGYHDTVAQLDVPGPGKEIQFVQPLAMADDVARVKLTSEPPGAQIMQNGQLVAGVTTPAELLVEAGKPVRFLLVMPKKVPAAIPVFTPDRGADNIQKTAKLVDGFTLSIESGLDAKVSVVGASHCQNLTTPATCVLPPGTHRLELTATGNVKATHEVKVVDKDATEKFEFGTVTVPDGKKLQVNGILVTKTTLEAGVRKVTVVDDEGPHPVSVTVKAGANVVAQ